MHAQEVCLLALQQDFLPTTSKVTVCRLPTDCLRRPMFKEVGFFILGFDKSF
jgi:hypothetical protein